jgi:hypothetical protein
MAKIYSVPKSINVPQLVVNGKFDYNDYQERVDKFYKELAALLREHSLQNEYIGEVIQFPVADGYAFYMVAGLNPVELIHLPIMDGWDFQYANRLTSKDIREKVEQQKNLKKLFGGK